MTTNNDDSKLPEGYYEAVAVRTTAEDDSNCFARFALTKGDVRQVVANFKILNPPDGFSLGFPLPWYGFFTKDAGRRTVESLKLMGLKGDQLSGAETQDLDQIVSVKVEHTTWEGVTRARVAFVNAPGGGSVKLNNPMSQDEIRKFSAMMRDSLAKVPDVSGERESGQSQPKAQKATEAPAQEEEEEDDIPF